jgi:hypothetical protein
MDFRASISRSAWAAPASNAARAAVVESWLGQIAASDISSATMTRTVAGRAPRARPRARLAGSRRARWDPRRSRRRGRPRNRPCTGRPATTPEPRTAHAIFRLIASVSSGEPQTPGADDVRAPHWRAVRFRIAWAERESARPRQRRSQFVRSGCQETTPPTRPRASKHHRGPSTASGPSPRWAQGQKSLNPPSERSTPGGFHSTAVRGPRHHPFR